MVAAIVVMLTPTAAPAVAPTVVPATPCGGSTGQNCYAYSGLEGKSFLQSHAQIRFNTLTTGGSTSQFVNTDMWVDNGTYWVEAGAVIGYLCKTSSAQEVCTSNNSYLITSPHFFWADYRPGGEAPQVLRRSYTGCGSRLRVA